LNFDDTVDIVIITLILSKFIKGSDQADESASLPGDSITQPTTNDCDDDEDDVDFNASFDCADLSRVQNFFCSAKNTIFQFIIQ